MAAGSFLPLSDLSAQRLPPLHSKIVIRHSSFENPVLRYLCIDYGSARTGLAISDETGMIARPYDVLLGTKELAERVAAIVVSEEIGTVILGLPTDLLGNETRTTRQVRGFFGRLRKLVDVPIITHDESLSSQRAVDRMIAAGIGRKKRRQKGTTDAWAAAVVLQEYLEENEG